MPSQDQQASRIDSLPHIQWWNQQWRQCSRPLVHWQLLWVECVTETLLLETTYLHRLACCGQRLVNPGRVREGQSVQQPQESYRRAVEEAAAAHDQRMRSMAKLSAKLGKRLWEE